MPQITWEQVEDLKHRQQRIYCEFANCILKLRSVNTALKELEEVIDNFIEEAEDGKTI